MRRGAFFPSRRRRPRCETIASVAARTLAHTKLASANSLETTRTRLFHNQRTAPCSLSSQVKATPCESFANTTCVHDSCAQDR